MDLSTVRFTFKLTVKNTQMVSRDAIMFFIGIKVNMALRIDRERIAEWTMGRVAE